MLYEMRAMGFYAALRASPWVPRLIGRKHASDSELCRGGRGPELALRSAMPSPDASAAFGQARLAAPRRGSHVQEQAVEKRQHSELDRERLRQTSLLVVTREVGLRRRPRTRSRPIAGPVPIANSTAANRRLHGATRPSPN